MIKTIMKQNETKLIGSENEEHTIWKSILLHLLPGLLGGFFYFGTVQFVRQQGFPSVSALIAAGALVITPFELGFLFYQARKRKQRIFNGVLAYLQPLPIWQYFIWVMIIIISSGLIITLLNPVTEYLRTLFNWIPNEMILDMGLTGKYSKTALIATYGLILLYVVIIGPVAEELYFRGYLLPRLPTRLKGMAPIVHSMLFALYHTWTPWMFVARTVGVLPIIYSVQHKKNLYIGIIAHGLLNSIDFFIGLVFIINHF